MTEDNRQESNRTPVSSEIWVLIAASFVIALGFGIVSPALPQFATEFGVGVFAASAVISTFALMRLLFAPASGTLVQKLGERPIYLSGLLIVALSTGACAFAQTYWQLLVFRGLGGIGSTMFSVSALGLLIRMSPPQSRGRISGLYATSFLLGSIGGPLLGGAVVGLGLRAPFLIYAVALVIAAAVVFFALGDVEEEKASADSSVPVLTLRAAWAVPAYRAALASNFATGWVIFGVRVALIPLFVIEVLQRSAAVAAVSLAVFAVGNAIVLTTAGRQSDLRGRKPFVVAGLVVAGVGTAGIGLTDDIALFMAFSVLAGVGSGLMTPAQQASIADVIGSKARGGPVLSTFQMSADVGAILGPVVAAKIVEGASYGTAFVASGVILLAAAAWWITVPEPGGRKSAAAPST
ncbi:MFS transporter [Rhodococcus sp. RS1C4]|uniref:MFS transporter n=1 Tax=Nocardiaceae TaxID=85025 RepID=UPI0003768898|nr:MULTISPECIES: MFS transporter [Rhodococcus]OZC44011.1 MFS transporter [Rhodococcus sp. RS1C4]OZC62385.1 MFS transporter [Rhodococcus sp. 06-621-2]OZC79815.1 MFS transporter [Rhodococcus sp. 06-418-1B]OZD19263.1 MFS transporter [Rhodococcus sp. 06-156-3C]OZD21597.1 MFS transporter [Rhodococcus sp. 06-156-4C]